MVVQYTIDLGNWGPSVTPVEFPALQELLRAYFSHLYWHRGVRAHVFLCNLAYLLVSLLRYHLRDIDFTPDKAWRTFPPCTRTPRAIAIRLPHLVYSAAH